MTRKNIKNGCIEYRRKKTGQLHSIAITSPLKTLLDKYLEGKTTKTAYVLNVVKGDTKEQQYTAVRDELRRYNRALKVVGRGRRDRGRNNQLYRSPQFCHDC